jgi:hypothetical protein
MLEVVIIERSPIKWEWQVATATGPRSYTDGKKLVGPPNTAATARYSSYWQPAKKTRLKHPDLGTVFKLARSACRSYRHVTFKSPLTASAFPRAGAASSRTF